MQPPRTHLHTRRIHPSTTCTPASVPGILRISTRTHTDAQMTHTQCPEYEHAHSQVHWRQESHGTTALRVYPDRSMQQSMRQMLVLVPCPSRLAGWATPLPSSRTWSRIGQRAWFLDAKLLCMYVDPQLLEVSQNLCERTQHCASWTHTYLCY
jgi:hypothetical protein